MDIPEFDTYKQTYWNHRYAVVYKMSHHTFAQVMEELMISLKPGKDQRSVNFILLLFEHVKESFVLFFNLFLVICLK